MTGLCQFDHFSRSVVSSSFFVRFGGGVGAAGIMGLRGLVSQVAEVRVTR